MKRVALILNLFVVPCFGVKNIKEIMQCVNIKSYKSCDKKEIKNNCINATLIGTGITVFASGLGLTYLKDLAVGFGVGVPTMIGGSILLAAGICRSRLQCERQDPNILDEEVPLMSINRD